MGPRSSGGSSSLSANLSLSAVAPLLLAASFVGGASSLSADLTVGAAQVLLTLSDFDDTGLDVECAALLEASGNASISATNFYADSDRGWV